MTVPASLRASQSQKSWALTCVNSPLTWLSQSRWVQRVENVGSTAPPCVWMICTHMRPTVSQLPRPGKRDLWSPVRQHFMRPTTYVHSVFPKVWTNYQLYLWAFPPSTTQQKWTLSPISSELLEEEWDALFLRQSAVDVLDKPADLSCGVSHVSGGRLNPNPHPRCHEHFPCWDSKKGVRHCQLVPGARSTAFKKLYS